VEREVGGGSEMDLSGVWLRRELVIRGVGRCVVRVRVGICRSVLDRGFSICKRRSI